MPWLRRLAGYVLAALILFFLGRFLLQSGDELAAHPFEFQVNYAALLGALVLYLFGLSLSVETWRRLLIELDGHLTFAQAFRLWFFSNLTRYIPGNIWQPATLVILGEQEGIPKSKVILSQTLFILLTLSLAGLFSIVLIPLPVATQVGLMIFSAVVIFFFAVPPIFQLVLRVVARLMRYETAPGTLTWLRGLTPLLVACSMWFAYGLSFYLFVRALGIVSGLTWFTAIALYAGAYLIGYISFLTPSGLGIREGALAFFLSAYVPASVAVVVALLARLLAVVGELVCVSAAWCATKITR